MKYIVCMLLFFSMGVHAQESGKKIIIKLSQIEKEELRFENPSDSLYMHMYKSILGGNDYALNDNIPDGEYTVVLNNKVRSVASIRNRKVNGSTIIYYDNGQIDRIIQSKNGIRHGLFQKFNQSGEVEFENLYHEGQVINGVIYRNGNIESQALDEENKNVIKLETSDVLRFLDTTTVNRPVPKIKESIACKESHSRIELRTFMDEFEEGGRNGFRSMVKEFSPEYFNSKDSKLKSIRFAIQNSRDGYYIMQTYKNYKPTQNEILFLLEEEREQELSSQKIYFLFGEKIREAILNQLLSTEAILQYLKCSVFASESFPDHKVISALQNELRNN